jgi:putative NADH-flavin reductase
MIGRRITAELSRRGLPVVRASRSGADDTAQIDANDVAALQAALTDDIQVLVVAIAPDLSSDGAPTMRETFEGIVEACRTSGNKRVFFVGGAGSLNMPNNKGRVIDNFPPDLPAFVKKKSQQHVEALPFLRSVKDVPWTYLSPPIRLLPDEPGKGKYKLGKDDVVSMLPMSVEDYALAAVDELVDPKHTYERFSVGSAETNL